MLQALQQSGLAAAQQDEVEDYASSELDVETTDSDTDSVKQEEENKGEDRPDALPVDCLAEADAEIAYLRSCIHDKEEDHRLYAQVRYPTEQLHSVRVDGQLSNFTVCEYGRLALHPAQHIQLTC